VISFFKKKSDAVKKLLLTDMHSHLLADVDDGVKSHDEAIQIIERFEQVGYKKIITTPHIMSDYYPNEPANLKIVAEALSQKLKEKNIHITLGLAAEYYLDEKVMRGMKASEKFLTFGDNLLLFETNFFAEPFNLNEFIFTALTQGYKPVLAHPERYQYMTLAKAEELRGRGTLLQLNLLSLAGFYGKPIEKMAIKLIEKGWVDLVGTDCHNLLQCKVLEDVFKNRYFKKALDLPLLNNTL
jgi:tyrosine-protein phosphatase YwqE